MRVKIIAVIFFLVGLVGTVQAQKGDINVTTGLLVSLPAHEILYGTGYRKTGIGLEATGQRNISRNRALLLQTGLVRYGYKQYVGIPSPASLVLFSLRAGYRYQFGATGIFLNVLTGVDIYPRNFAVEFALPIGVGKRFTIKDAYFMDIGVDYVLVPDNYSNRLNLKAAFSILRRPKPENYKLL